MRSVESCKFHRDKPAIDFCVECGCGLCKWCIKSNGEDIYCKDHERKKTRGVYKFK